MQMTKPCRHCEFIETLFSKVVDMTDREYYLFTELFCYLHDGKDYCDHETRRRSMRYLFQMKWFGEVSDGDSGNATKW